MLRQLIKELIPNKLRPIILLRRYQIFALELNKNRGIKLSEAYSYCFITTREQYYEAISAGFDFSLYPENENIEAGLKAGACMLCLFKEKSLAHTTWLASDYSRAVYDSIFILGGIGDASDAFIGPCNTYHPYRGRGLYPSALLLACEYLKNIGAKRAFINCKISNVSSVRGIEKACFKKAGRIWICYFLGKKYRFNNLKLRKYR